jgi:hypothetical protein
LDFGGGDPNGVRAAAIILDEVVAMLLLLEDETHAIV